eukprot:6245285-Amphidinium_carterae.1
MPARLTPLEAQLCVDLLADATLPKNIKTEIQLQGIDTFQGILRLVFRQFLPSESDSRLAGLAAVEKSIRLYDDLYDVQGSSNYLLKVVA